MNILTGLGIGALIVVGLVCFAVLSIIAEGMKH